MHLQGYYEGTEPKSEERQALIDNAYQRLVARHAKGLGRGIGKQHFSSKANAMALRPQPDWR